jgi:nucleotide-binding universal stress UspA family protein
VKTRNIRAFRSVLVPLDGSPLAEQAIPLALEVARVARSKVRLVLVHQILPPPFYEETAQLYVSIDLAMRKTERDYLRGLVAQLRERSGLQISSVMLEGSTEQALVEYVQDIRADLVVMTTHGRSGVRGAWLGSVADHLIRRLDVPVIVTRAREGTGSFSAPPNIREILVPLDGSPLAEAALAPAMALAGLFDAELVLVQVVPPSSAGTLLPVTFAAGYDAEIVALQRKKAQEYLAGLSELLQERGSRVKTTVAVGHNVGETLINLAHPERIDLVAIATHGRGGVRRLMLGSVADKLIRAAGPPVLVVRPGKGRKGDHTTSSRPKGAKK